MRKTILALSIAAAYGGLAWATLHPAVVQPRRVPSSGDPHGTGVFHV